MKLFLLPAGAAALFAGVFHATGGEAQPASAKAATAPVLIELFTSQGCSSCPPADRLAQRLAREPGLVVISRPVTYWDRLGWKDTLAREANTRLQRSYAARGLDGYNGVYTPQMVVDGTRGAIGSNEAEVRAMVHKARGASAAIAVRRQGDGQLAIGLGGAADDPAELVLIGLRSHATVRVLHGENGNRQLGYTNVVVSERVLSNWGGGRHRLTLPADALAGAGADRHALVLRTKDAGPILAARML